MATLYIEEYQSLPDDARGQTVPAAGSIVTTQTITSISATSQQSAAFNAKTTFIMVTADVAVQVAIGTSPTAGSTDAYIPADVPRPFSVPPRGTFKIAARTQA